MDRNGPPVRKWLRSPPPPLCERAGASLRPRSTSQQRSTMISPRRSLAVIAATVFVLLAPAQAQQGAKSSAAPAQLFPAGIYPLAPEREQALKPKDSFKECDVCPEMVVVPKGT